MKEQDLENALKVIQLSYGDKAMVDAETRIKRLSKIFGYEAIEIEKSNQGIAGNVLRIRVDKPDDIFVEDIKGTRRSNIDGISIKTE